MKVLFAGGGTMGSVSPLLAIYEQLKEKEPEMGVLWLGTKKGAEKEVLNNYQIPFKPIIAGKLRQYFSLLNFFTPLFVFFGFIQAAYILLKFKPAVVLTAGSFVAVPVVYAAWILRIPRFIHQQDIERGLANKLMAKVATVITVTFRDSLADFSFKKTFHISNPVRKSVFTGSREKAMEYFGLNSNLRTILIMGGGQGARIINQMVLETIGKLTAEYQIIHITGKGKGIVEKLPNFYDRATMKTIEVRYRPYEFLDAQMPDTYAVADLVVSRAGMSTLTELAVLAKPALLIPIPGHQELNAQYFAKYNAAKVIKQEQLNSENFTKAILYLMGNPADLQNLSRNISTMIDKDAAKRYVGLIYEVLGK